MIPKDLIMQKLRQVALRDGVISTDEEAILENVEHHLASYEFLWERVMADNVLEFDEYLQLKSARNEMFDDTFRVALLDEQITMDERQLLIRLLEVIPLLAGNREVARRTTTPS